MSHQKPLRSASWFQSPDYYGFARRAWLRSEGFNQDVFEGKPVIGICNSWSELNNCNAHLRDVAEAVKRGVWAAGGFPLEFPTISLGEMFLKPTSMLFRNLMAMDVEESIRANPLDGVVLLCGCDKTTPAQLMGAASADIPSIMVPGGPMLSGQWRERRLGAGTDGRKLFDLYRSGKLSDEEWCEIESCIARSAGHCSVMGTASTMTSLAEALGMTLPGCANIPAVDSRRYAIAELSGRRIVEMVAEDLRPSNILTREAFENAVTACMALGGSTNAVVHLIAIAGRLGVDLTVDDFDRISRRTPFLANIKPSGEYLMEDFFEAGALPAMLKEILPTASWRMHHSQRAHPGGERPRVRLPRRTHHPLARQSSALRGRHRRASRQSVSRWRCDQADRRDTCAAALIAGAPMCSKIAIRCASRSTATTFPSTPPPCW